MATTDAADAGMDSLADEEEHSTEDDTPAPAPTQSVQTPRAEYAVLRIVETPNGRLTDKIVQLHGVGPGMTNAEQANFREIAKRLEAFGMNTSNEDGETKPAADEAQKAIDEAPRTDLINDNASQGDEVVAETTDQHEDSAEV